MKHVCYPILLCSLIANADESVPERLTVVGDSHHQFSRLDSINPSLTLNKEQALQSSNIANLLTQIPEVNLSGQGGQFQVVSIRGFSRWRIQTQLDGVPIFSDRRAGTAAEFIPSSWIEQAIVSTGAVSTYLGSGAIGGGVDLKLFDVDSRQISTSYSHQQNQVDFDYRGSTGNVQWAINRQDAGNGKDAQGNTLFNQFEQNTGLIRGQFDQGYIDEAWLLYSEGNNLGKSTSDFPNNRITIYPTNDHWLGKLSFDLASTNLDVYWHKSRLDTEIERIGNRQNVIRNDAFDYGFKLNREFRVAGWSGQWRLSGDGRADVSATEREIDVFQSVVFDRQILDGSQFEVSIAGDLGKDIGRWSLVAGGRFARQQQENQNNKIIDINQSAFVGARYQLFPQWALSSYVSSAYRTPNLTERFFNGQTPRGQTLGDPSLDTERALNSQFSVHYNQSYLSGYFSLFHQSIEDYIERLEVENNLLLYVNLSKATIKGASYQLVFPTLFGSLQLGGQWLDAEDEIGNPIADVTPNNHSFRLVFDRSNWSFITELLYRQSKRDIASNEQVLPSTLIGNVGIKTKLFKQVEIDISLSNITDKQYLTTTDDRAPFATGRDVKINIRYNF